MMTKLLGLASERIESAVEIGVDLQRKIRSLRLEFMGAGPYGGSYAPLLLNLIRLASALSKYANVCGPPDLRAVAHRLRISDLEADQCQVRKFGDCCSDALRFFIER